MSSYSCNGVHCAHSLGRQLECVWDPIKAERNLRKHGVEFVDVVIVFNDDRAITLPDEHPNEERYLTFGMDAYGRISTVSYEVRDGAVRIISARRATRREQAQNEDKRI